MSNIISFPIGNKVSNDDLYKRLETFHLECIEDIQKNDEYKNIADKKLYLRDLIITKYNADEKIVDELIEVASELTAFVYEYVNNNLPKNIFQDN